MLYYINMSLTLVGFLNLTVAMINHIVINSKTEVKSMSVRVAHANAPINIKPHYPHPGYIGEKVGRLTCFDTKTCPICGEFDHLPYACATIKSTDDQIPHIFLDFSVG